MAKIERVSENICLAKCAHTSVWTTQALGACLKVYTFHLPSRICSDSQSFLKAYFSQFGVSYVISWFSSRRTIHNLKPLHISHEIIPDWKSFGPSWQTWRSTSICCHPCSPIRYLGRDLHPWNWAPVTRKVKLSCHLGNPVHHLLLLDDGDILHHTKTEATFTSLTLYEYVVLITCLMH